LKRLEWAKKHVIWDNKLRKVLFSDEKKFNLDRTDGCQYYWHDLRKEPQHYSKHSMGGGSVMVWAAFGYNGRMPIVFLNGLQKAEDYKNVLRTSLLPSGVDIC